MTDHAVFTDPQAAIEEAQYLAETLGESHVVVSVLQVLPQSEASSRGALVLETCRTPN